MARWQDNIQRGTRAAQPLASTVTVNGLYCVSDESDIIEISDGSAWLPIGTTTPSAIRQTNAGRLGLVTADPLFNPQILTPSSTDTGAETVTFAADHLWVNGTIVTPLATASGLTMGTMYYFHVTSTTAGSFHTTLTTAISGASPVNLTGNVTAEIQPKGVASKTIYFTPFAGNQIALYTSSAWAMYDFTEVSFALTALTSGKNYDVFLYDNTGTLTLALSTAWTSDILRADALALQDGVYVLGSDHSKRYVGTIRTTDTDSTEDSLYQSYVWNMDNRIERYIGMEEYNTVDDTYNNPAIRQYRGSTLWEVRVLVGLSQDMIDITGISTFKPASVGVLGIIAIGQDGIVARPVWGMANATTWQNILTHYKAQVPLGYHVYKMLQQTNTVSSSAAWMGRNPITSGGGTISGMSGYLKR